MTLMCLCIRIGSCTLQLNDRERVPDTFRWDVVDVRGIVRENTEYIYSLIDIQGISLSVAPEER